MTVNHALILMVAALALHSCSGQSATQWQQMEMAGLATDSTFRVCYTDTLIRASYRIVEENPGCFIRVVFSDGSDRSGIAFAANELLESFSRVDVCHADATARGDEYVSFMGDMICDYESGATMSVSQWLGQ